jgi:Choline dehydrogenase and related flavoproteins
MQGFRRAVEVLAHEKVRAMTGVTFPVKFTDRLRRLNRITPANKVQSAVIAALIDLVPPLAGPIFSTLADRRVDLALVADDDALAAHIRENVAGTFHPVGTCRMGGANDRDAVVDPRAGCAGSPACGHRCLDHADSAARQYQYPDHHGGGKNLRDHGRRGPGGGVRATTPHRSSRSAFVESHDRGLGQRIEMELKADDRR